MFPHKFLIANNLKYIGEKPGFNYYVDEHKLSASKLKMKLAEYEEIPSVIDIKQQSLEYLKKDVLGLLEAMNKVSEQYFNDYGLNITKFSTLPGLSLAIFGYWFYKDSPLSTPIHTRYAPCLSNLRVLDMVGA